MILQVFDLDEKRLPNIETIGSPKHKRVVNGEDTFEFETDALDLQEGFRILYKDHRGRWHEQIVVDIDLSKSQESGTTLRVYCESSFYETEGDYIIEQYIRNATATAALQLALEPTRWEVGQVDNLGLAGTNYYRESAKSAIQRRIIPRWKAELQTRIEVGHKVTRRFVDLRARIGADNGKRFEVNKDMPEIRREVSMRDFCTALYGFGRGEELDTGGFGRRIDFGELNNGKMYVANEDARETYGYTKEGIKQHIFGKIEIDDCEDRAELLQLTTEALAERSTPRVTYRAKVIDLRKYGFTHEGIDLGDSVLVIDNDLGIRVKARVLEYTDYPDNTDENEIVLGQFVRTLADHLAENEEYINNFRSKSGVWDRAEFLSPDGIDASYIDGLLEALNEKANATGGWIWIKDGEGLLSRNALTHEAATEAVQIIGGTIRIANQKKANGDWEWRTAITGGGVIADAVYAGILRGGKVHWNLEDGTLLIGNGPTDYSLYWDGSTLSIKGDNIDLSANEAITSRVTKEQILTDSEIRDALKGDPGTPGEPGEPGEPGPPGQPGPAGQDATKEYVHWMFADDANGTNMSHYPEDKPYLGIGFPRPNPTPSRMPIDYYWNLFRGSANNAGLPARPDKWYWVKFADDRIGNGMSDSIDRKKYIGFSFLKDTPVKSNNPADYEWHALYASAVHVSAQPPSYPQEGDTWVDQSLTPPQMFIYTDGVWTKVNDLGDALLSLSDKVDKEALDQLLDSMKKSVLSEVSTKITQTNEAIDFRFNSAKTLIENVESNTNTRFEEQEKYIRFENGVIKLGEVGNPLSIEISNEKISFLYNGMELYFIADGKTYFRLGHFQEGFQIGDFNFGITTAGDLVVR